VIQGFDEFDVPVSGATIHGRQAETLAWLLPFLQVGD
jgi:hypothetical protein